ncbi:unnamed protein product [Notodromas monacha]|uniref:Sushi domain-containing protein n=1 Tax=Notodromas monacha TaxID=399045 RepID=A0A7R9BD00_9CRUS|nr:unnamed protein product [Notodromas monacha]CAG0913080.1 unnamed protein product [Notodromas monacha]
MMGIFFVSLFLLMIPSLAFAQDNVGLESVQIPPGLLPARLESAGAAVESNDGVNYGGCSENDIPVVDNGILQAADRALASSGELSYQCLAGFQNDQGDKWTVKVSCQFDPVSASYVWNANGACVPQQDEAKCDTVPVAPANAQLPEMDSLGGLLKFVSGAKVYFDCVDKFSTSAGDGVTPPYSECLRDGSWSPVQHECVLAQRIQLDEAAKKEEMAKTEKEKHARFFHADDPAGAEAETDAERFEHDAIIDRFVHLTNAKGLPHNEELHRLVHHGPAAAIDGGDIENDFPADAEFVAMAPGGPDVQQPLMEDKEKLRREERTLLALLKKQDEVLHPERKKRRGSDKKRKTKPKSKKATVRKMEEHKVDYTDSQWADIEGDGPKPGYHVAVRNTDGRFEMMPNNPKRLHAYHSTVKADIDRKIRRMHQLGGDDREVKTPRPRQDHNPYYVLFLVLGTFLTMVSGAGCLINHYGLLDLDSSGDECPPMPKCKSVKREQAPESGDQEEDCGKPWWEFC